MTRLPILPSAEVADLLFRCGEKLDKYISANPVQDLDMWNEVIAALDQIASAISEAEALCDNCAMHKSTGKDMLCNECRETQVT